MNREVKYHIIISVHFLFAFIIYNFDLYLLYVDTEISDWVDNKRRYEDALAVREFVYSISGPEMYRIS